MGVTVCGPVSAWMPRVRVVAARSVVGALRPLVQDSYAPFGGKKGVVANHAYLLQVKCGAEFRWPEATPLLPPTHNQEPYDTLLSR